MLTLNDIEIKYLELRIIDGGFISNTGIEVVVSGIESDDIIGDTLVLDSDTEYTITNIRVNRRNNESTITAVSLSQQNKIDKLLSVSLGIDDPKPISPLLRQLRARSSPIAIGNTDGVLDIPNNALLVTIANCLAEVPVPLDLYAPKPGTEIDKAGYSDPMHGPNQRYKDFQYLTELFSARIRTALAEQTTFKGAIDTLRGFGLSVLFDSDNEPVFIPLWYSSNTTHTLTNDNIVRGSRGVAASKKVAGATAADKGKALLFDYQARYRPVDGIGTFSWPIKANDGAEVLKDVYKSLPAAILGILEKTFSNFQQTKIEVPVQYDSKYSIGDNVTTPTGMFKHTDWTIGQIVHTKRGEADLQTLTLLNKYDPSIIDFAEAIKEHAPPAKPKNFRYVATAGNAILVRWDDPDSGGEAEEYTAEITDATFANAFVPHSARGLVFLNLKAEIDYTIKVQAINAAGQSEDASVDISGSLDNTSERVDVGFDEVGRGRIRTIQQFRRNGPVNATSITTMDNHLAIRAYSGGDPYELESDIDEKVAATTKVVIGGRKFPIDGKVYAVIPINSKLQVSKPDSNNKVALVAEKIVNHEDNELNVADATNQAITAYGQASNIGFVLSAITNALKTKTVSIRAFTYARNYHINTVKPIAVVSQKQVFIRAGFNPRLFTSAVLRGFNGGQAKHIFGSLKNVNYLTSASGLRIGTALGVGFRAISKFTGPLGLALIPVEAALLIFKIRTTEQGIHVTAALDDGGYTISGSKLQMRAAWLPKTTDRTSVTDAQFSALDLKPDGGYLSGGWFNINRGVERQTGGIVPIGGQEAVPGLELDTILGADSATERTQQFSIHCLGVGPDYTNKRFFVQFRVSTDVIGSGGSPGFLTTEILELPNP